MLSQFRLLQRTDLPACATIYAKVFSAPPWSEVWTDQAALTRLQHLYDSKGFVGMLFEKQEVQGFVLGTIEPFNTGNLFYLREMCMAQEVQAQGLGSQLFNAFEQQLRLHEVEQIYLATARGSNAEKFYARLGFAAAQNMVFYDKKLMP